MTTISHPERAIQNRVLAPHVEAKVAKARQFKQGMMQELLTGKIRLI